MTRKIDWKNLDGIIYDYACGLQRYALNREPVVFQYKRFLVDGCHFRGHSKKSKRKTANKSGHTGCSNSSNFMEYKAFTSKHKDGGHLSQGREIMHSVLDKLAPSLRQKNYANFMRSLIVFFTIRNLKIMNKKLTN